MLLLATIFLAGLLHGIGPDHLAAISAFAMAVEHDVQRVVGFAARFALGHALVIGAAGVAAHFGRLLLSPQWERRCDLAAGMLLIVTGLLAAVGLATGKIKVHGHAHAHARNLHSHFHLHFLGRQEEEAAQHGASKHGHVHGATAAILGMLFALGGIRSLVAVVPMAIAGTLAGTIVRLGAFVVGIILAMVGYAFVSRRAFERLANRATAVGRESLLFALSSYLLALFCIVAGVLAIRERLLG